MNINLGGPDENPRFEKNLFMGAKTFKVCNLQIVLLSL